MSTQRRDELPLADYDHLPVTALRDRIRSLTSEQLEQLLTYEREHADRLPVVMAMRTRLEELEQGATPTSGQHDIRPEQPGGTRHGSAVSGGVTSGSVTSPPHGVPAQSGQPKGDRYP
ncbi:hypothetical protein [Saccharomonospora sp.]|uniref:hypothetical protein n=1 Tax=Saccharomonospora sp. TaxID=33913 RepID=UPI00262C5F5A|nr:hypothetical protein [Saccharomonospora sp.]